MVHIQDVYDSMYIPSAQPRKSVLQEWGLEASVENVLPNRKLPMHRVSQQIVLLDEVPFD